MSNAITQSNRPLLDSRKTRKRLPKLDTTESSGGLFSRLTSLLSSTVSNMASAGLNKAAMASGVIDETDANLNASEVVKKGARKAKKMVEVLNQNPELADELGQNLGDTVERVLQPALNKGANIAHEFVEKESKAITGLAANIAEDIAFPIVAPVRTFLSGVDVAENAMNAAADATGLLKDQVQVYNDAKEKIENTMEKINHKANELLDHEIQRQQQSNPYSNNPEPAQSEVKNLRVQGMQAGGRVRKSRTQFTSRRQKKARRITVRKR